MGHLLTAMALLTLSVYGWMLTAGYREYVAENYPGDLRWYSGWFTVVLYGGAVFYLAVS